MLSHDKVKTMLLGNEITIEPFFPENFKGPGFRLHLGSWYELSPGSVLDLDSLGSLEQPVAVESGEVKLLPNQMMLAKTLEKVGIPLGSNVVGWLQTRRTLANLGLQVNLGDSYLLPGLEGEVWLQLKNQSDHTLVMRRGTDLARLFFFDIS